MNNHLIEKLIKLNDEACPEFTFSNPLLDRNITSAIAKSIVKSLYKNEQICRKPSSRTAMLQTIRNLCISAPEGHMEIDDDLTEILTSFYEKQLLTETTSPTSKNIEKQLDAFLNQKLKPMNLNSSYSSSVNPEVLQAMLNLNESVVFTETITNDIIHWNCNDQKSKTVVQNLWNEKVYDSSFYNNISIKMKSEIESLLLNILYRLLEDYTIESELLYSDSELNSLVIKSSKSAECFQICTYILNSLFIKTNFNKRLEEFIFQFIQNVKLKTKITISVLYPYNLSNIVTILDLNMEELPIGVKDGYVDLAKKYLKSLHLSSENDIIMLLTHFPTWFNIYFDDI